MCVDQLSCRDSFTLGSKWLRSDDDRQDVGEVLEVVPTMVLLHHCLSENSNLIGETSDL